MRAHINNGFLIGDLCATEDPAQSATPSRQSRADAERLNRYAADSPRSNSKKELSKEEKEYVRKRNMRLRDIFSLLDFGRTGDLTRGGESFVEAAAV